MSNKNDLVSLDHSLLSSVTGGWADRVGLGLWAAGQLPDAIRTAKQSGRPQEMPNGQRVLMPDASMGMGRALGTELLGAARETWRAIRE